MDSTNSWWIDSRTIDHTCNLLQRFQHRRRLDEGEMQLILAYATRIFVQVVGDVTLVWENNKHLELMDCFYTLEFRNNPI